MPGEDDESTGEKAGHMAEGRLLVIMRKVAVLELLDQQTEVIMQEVVGHPNGAEEMVEKEGLVTNVIGVINGDIDHLNVQKQNKLDIRVHMLQNQKKQWNLPKK